jgi:lipoprotein-anchoring transpeptidase ErfK/SrfK
MRKSFDQLKIISFLLTAIYAASALFPATARAGSGFFGGGANRAEVLVHIDKTNQQMTVSVDGSELYHWPVSTGRAGYETPSGTYTATSMNEIWYSKEFDNAPMPHAVFFIRDGHAIHGTYEVKNLGKPVSHGCVRISPGNAAILYGLVQANGLEHTKVVLTGSSPGDEYADDYYVAKDRTSPRAETSGRSSGAPHPKRSQVNDQQPWNILHW